MCFGLVLVFNKYQVLKNIDLYIRVKKKKLACVYLVISDTIIYRTKGTLSQMNVNMNIKCGPCTQKHWISLCAHTHKTLYIHMTPTHKHFYLASNLCSIDCFLCLWGGRSEWVWIWVRMSVLCNSQVRPNAPYRQRP